jgi:hypothetical protein
VNALAEHLESVGGRVAVLPAVGFRTGLFGGRALDRPDLVVAILPARGSSMSAVRLAERLGSPLLALLTSEAPGSRTETAALRRATRVAVTTTDLQHAAIAAGVAQDRVDRWDALRPSALSHFDQIAARTLRTTAKPRATRS